MTINQIQHIMNKSLPTLALAALTLTGVILQANAQEKDTKQQNVSVATDK